MTINFFINPRRKINLTYKSKLKNIITQLPINIGLWLGFNNIEYSYIHGCKTRVKLGANCSTMNTIFNVISGDIKIDDNTIMGHNCMLLTGTHNFSNGKLCSLNVPPLMETPQIGRDIIIGKGCFIGSGVIILGNVTIGDNVIIGAGSVVTRSIPSNKVACGIPATIASC